MENKPVKIHQLKGRSKAAEPVFGGLVSKPSMQIKEACTNIPKVMSKPILIRYIDPRLVPIFKELNHPVKTNEQAHKQPYVVANEGKGTLEPIKNIDPQTCKITFVTNANAIQASKASEKTEASDDTNKSTVIDAEKKDIIEAIIVQQRLSEDECEESKLIVGENEELKAELSKEKNRSKCLEDQNKELKEKLKLIESEKKEIIGNIKTQLVKLKDKSLRC